MTLSKVRLDLNNPEFQAELFHLQKEEQILVLGTLKKIKQMDWLQIYKDPGLKWELIHSKAGPQGEKLYSFRLGKGFRAIAFRQDQWLRILSLHPDHDSAYQ